MSAYGTFCVSPGFHSTTLALLFSFLRAARS